MMKAKRILAILCSIMMFWSVPTFAEEQSITQQYTQPIQYVSKDVEVRKGTVTFITKSEEHNRDCRCYAEGEIKIKENSTGLLQDGDIIYFETSKDGDRYASSGGALIIEAKGVSAEEVHIEDSSEAKNHFAVHISRESKKELAEINIKFDFYCDGYYDNTDKVIFSLSLDTDKTKEKNLFAGQEDTILNEQFLTLHCINWDKKEQEFKQSLPQMIFTAGKDVMIWNGEQKQLKHIVYVNQNGAAMLSMEDFADIVNDLMNITDNVYLFMLYDKDSRLSDITVGKDSFFIDFKDNTLKKLDSIESKAIENVAEENNGIRYVTLRSVATIFDMEGHIVWNNNTKTVTIK